jgi:hypothetical protein
MKSSLIGPTTVHTMDCSIEGLGVSGAQIHYQSSIVTLAHTWFDYGSMLTHYGFIIKLAPGPGPRSMVPGPYCSMFTLWGPGYGPPGRGQNPLSKSYRLSSAKWV